MNSLIYFESNPFFKDIITRLANCTEEVQLVDANNTSYDNLRTWYKDDIMDIHDMGPSFGIHLIGGKIYFIKNNKTICKMCKVKSIVEKKSCSFLLRRNTKGFSYRFRAETIIVVKTELGAIYKFLPTCAEIKEEPMPIMGWLY